MIQAMEDMFWQTGTQLVQLIVPIVALALLFRLFNSVLFGGSRRG